MELVNRLPVHKYSVDIFPYSGLSGILCSGGKYNTVGAVSLGVVACSISYH